MASTVSEPKMKQAGRVSEELNEFLPSPVRAGTEAAVSEERLA